MQPGSNHVDFVGKTAHEQILAGRTHGEEFQAKQRLQKSLRRQGPFCRARQKFIPAIKTGSTRPCRIGNATASRTAPFWKIPRPLDTPAPAECLASGDVPCSQTAPVS